MTYGAGTGGGRQEPDTVHSQAEHGKVLEDTWVLREAPEEEDFGVQFFSHPSHSWLPEEKALFEGFSVKNG